MGELQLSVKDTARVMGITERAVRWKISNNKMKANPVKSDKGGRGGVEYLIPLSSLPIQAQKKAIKLFKEEVQESADQKTQAPLEAFSDQEREQIAFWRNCLDQWQAFRSQPGMTKAELDELFCEKWNQDHPEKPVSAKTLHRKYKAWTEQGDVALIDRRGGWNRGESTIPDVVWNVFQQYYLSENRPSARACYRWTSLWAEQNGYSPLPSYKAFERRISTIPYAVIRMYRYGEKDFDDKVAPFARRSYEGLASNDIWVADNHVFDVSVKRPDGSIYRPWVTKYIDVRSRKVMSVVVSDNPNSDTNLLALRKGILKYGIPKVVYTDNGMDFLASDIAGRGRRKTKKNDGEHKPPAVFERLGITMMNAKVKNAKAKPVERLFKEVKENFSKLFSTYQGGNVMERPERLLKILKNPDNIVTEAEFIEAFETFAFGWYDHQPHYGDGMNGKTPHQVYAENLIEKRTALPEDLDLMMMRSSKPVTVGRNGVRLTLYGYGLDYYNADLVAQYRGKKVYVRYDPENMGEVRVYDLEDRFLMTATHRKALSYNATKEDIRQVASEAKKIKKRVKAYKEALVAEIYAPDPMDLVMEKARKNLEQATEAEAKVISPVRSGERPTEKPSLKQAVGQSTSISLARMIETAKKFKK
ncbi:Mu transposase C-terminal domain-containing protein [Brevibacillus thermoruber]|uniref:Mu transposase C-terminal domain-containing protein n=1 Tax=Brevibacillus thermoruber TaxID=33942 RepID=UPI00054DE494|nr:Mu transposase C-terminal domain-containing protein [Brevibacillus thermoruber]